MHIPYSGCCWHMTIFLFISHGVYRRTFWHPQLICTNPPLIVLVPLAENSAVALPSILTSGAEASSLVFAFNTISFALSMVMPELSNTILLPVSYTHLRAHETDSYLVC